MIPKMERKRYAYYLKCLRSGRTPEGNLIAIGPTDTEGVVVDVIRVTTNHPIQVYRGNCFFASYKGAEPLEKSFGDSSLNPDVQKILLKTQPDSFVEQIFTAPLKHDGNVHLNKKNPSLKVRLYVNCSDEIWNRITTAIQHSYDALPSRIVAMQATTA